MVEGLARVALGYGGLSTQFSLRRTEYCAIGQL
jgi:hypothetical protein